MVIFTWFTAKCILSRTIHDNDSVVELMLMLIKVIVMMTKKMVTVWMGRLILYNQHSINLPWLNAQAKITDPVTYVNVVVFVCLSKALIGY